MGYTGASNHTGFYITFNGCRLSTSQYDDSEGIHPERKLVHPYGMVLGASSHIIFSVLLVADWLGRFSGAQLNAWIFIPTFICAFLLALFSAALGMVLFSIPFMPKRAKQWHAAEHKLIKLLRAGEAPTVHSLQERRPFSFGCGVYHAGIIYGALLFLLAAITGGFALFDEVAIYTVVCAYVFENWSFAEPTPKQYSEAVDLGWSIRENNRYFR